MTAGDVAVLSDIHGVLPALEAVLAEPDVVAADRLVLTGDIAAGPQPVQVLDRLVALGDRVAWVRGNADRELLVVRADPHLEVPDEIVRWAARQLDDSHVALLAGLPHPVTLSVAGFGDVLFCHGSPRDDDEVVLVDTRLARWEEALADVPATVRTVVCGHTHMPFVRLAHGRLVVNPGSVGMPYGRVGAHWALLTHGEVSLRRTLYDVAAAVESVSARSGYPDARQWAEYYLPATATDAEVIAAFGPRDGR